jgi:predicted RNA-binding Zn ribbon-like protein
MDPLWADLINSDWRDALGSGRREDRLENDAWLARFLARIDWRDGKLPGRAGRQRLRTLRGMLRRMVDALRARRSVSREDLAALNRILAQGSWQRRLDRHRGVWQVATLSRAHGIKGAATRVAWSFAEMLATGDPTRIKICANPDCAWVMYDESRNRTRQWCEASECGNLIKVRRFRERHRGEGAPRSTGGRRG